MSLEVFDILVAESKMIPNNVKKRFRRDVAYEVARDLLACVQIMKITTKVWKKEFLENQKQFLYEKYTKIAMEKDFESFRQWVTHGLTLLRGKTWSLSRPVHRLHKLSYQFKMWDGEDFQMKKTKLIDDLHQLSVSYKCFAFVKEKNDDLLIHLCTYEYFGYRSYEEACDTCIFKKYKGGLYSVSDFYKKKEYKGKPQSKK